MPEGMAPPEAQLAAEKEIPMEARLEDSGVAQRESSATLFNESLNHGNPFSNNAQERTTWFNSLDIPTLDWEKEEVKIIGQVGKGDRGKVYKVQSGESTNVVKFYRKGNVEEAVRREYAGLLATHHLFPDVFPEPLGQIVDQRGKVIGLEMEYIPKREVNDFIDMEKYQTNGVIEPKEGVIIPKSFFERLRSVVTELGKHNLWLNDFNGGKVLTDEDWKPSIVDVQYYPRGMYDWEPDAVIGTIEEMEDMFNTAK